MHGKPFFGFGNLLVGTPLHCKGFSVLSNCFNLILV
jgi:hypothetical protein